MEIDEQVWGLTGTFYYILFLNFEPLQCSFGDILCPLESHPCPLESDPPPQPKVSCGREKVFNFYPIEQLVLLGLICIWLNPSTP